ncbi:MAG: 4-hydroxythreonine-4-phosphate dehydrogenase PdxA [Acidobacteriota bacterium]
MATENLRRRPVVGITMGDAAGIGPEVVLKALADDALRHQLTIKIIGDEAHLRHVADSIGLSDVIDQVEVVDLKNLPEHILMGVDAVETGKASAEYIVKAVDLWRAGEIDAIATAPISKKAIALGGYDFPGHTEFLAQLTETKQFAMSFFADELRVILLSTHLALREAIDLVETDKLVKLIDFADRQLDRLLGRKIKLAIAGLNPHASEGGMFGREEIDEIIPAVDQCQKLGIDISGPFSPDTIFLRCAKGEFDAVIALYHDQATIPVKAISFNSGVNVTLGLPLVRTSVDHGTAFAIAGKGVAESSSMAAAIKLAGELVLSK